jgi:16S rRNA (uracil1498-N3)-methyltransferase
MHARFYAPDLAAAGSVVELPPEEAEHLSRVLRLRAGAEVRLFDGKGHEHAGRVERVERSRAFVTVGSRLPDAGREPSTFLVLAQALLKGDGMDQVVRDAVMLGVSRLMPIETEHCEMPARRVTASGRVARWQRIAVASAKQCGRAVAPEVTEPRRLAACLGAFEGTDRYLLVEPGLVYPGGEPAAGASPPSPPPSALLVVGPEGGWAPDEVALAMAAACRPLTLGPRTLRADAAALVGLTALQALWGGFASIGVTRAADAEAAR